MAMEPRGIVAKPEPTGDLTVWLSTQSPHRVRTDLATAIGFPEHRIRVIAPDVGGGFGSKGLLYQEDALASHLALKLGRLSGADAVVSSASGGWRLCRVEPGACEAITAAPHCMASSTGSPKPSYNDG